MCQPPLWSAEHLNLCVSARVCVMELIDPRQKAEGCRRGLMGSPGPPQRTHSQEDPSSTAAQRDTSPALLPCGSATAWLSRLTTCSQLLLASPGQVPPKVLHVLLALTLSLSSCTFPPPHPFSTAGPEYLQPKPSLAPLCVPPRFAGARYTSTEPVLELGHLAVRPRS